MSLPLTREWLVDRYLTGVDLTDDSGTAYPDEQFTHALAAAVEWVKRALDIELEETAVVERHDWDAQQWDQWAFLQLRKRPLLEVTGLKLKYGTAELLSVPAEWIVQTVPEAAQLQLVPLSSATLQPATGFGVLPWIGPGLGGSARTIPAYYEVSYRAGFPCWSVTGLGAGAYPPAIGFGGLLSFAQTAAAGVGGTSYAIVGTATDGSLVETVTIAAGSAGPARSRKTWETVASITPTGLPGGASWAVRAAKVPSDVLHLVGMYAALFPLNTAGDLIAGAGIAQRSFSMDGLSSSVSTTASATNAGYGARILQYTDEIKRLLPLVRRAYHGVSMRVG